MLRDFLGGTLTIMKNKKKSKMTPDFCNDYKRIADGHGSNDNNKNNLNRGKFKLIIYI
jgi:hypothetical protein